MSYELIVNNNTDFLTHPSSQGISIIDLALTSSKFGPFWVLETPEKYPLLSNYKFILMEWEDIEAPGQKNT